MVIAMNSAQWRWMGWTLMVTFGVCIGLGACDGQHQDVAEDSGVDAGPEDWQPDWPNEVADETVAGDALLTHLRGRWDLDLSPGDEDCPATDCPGDADGWDPMLGQGWTPYQYAAVVRQTGKLFRTIDIFKSLEENGTGVGQLYGSVTYLYRKAVDGRLVTVPEQIYDEELDGPLDFGPLLGFDEDDQEFSWVFALPYGDTTLGLHMDLAEDAIAVGGTLAFRAPRTETELPHELPPGYEELATSTDASRLVDLLDQAAMDKPHLTLEYFSPMFDAMLVLLENESADVRQHAAALLLSTFGESHYFPRLIVLDRLIGRLVGDPEEAVRQTVADGLLELLGDETIWYYHCDLHQAAEECRTVDPSSEVASTCQQIVELGLVPYGSCSEAGARTSSR